MTGPDDYTNTRPISVAELLLDNGLLLTTEGRHPDSRQTFRSGNGALLEGVPMVAIMNGRSASAAEIVGAAFKVRDELRRIGKEERHPLSLDVTDWHAQPVAAEPAAV